MRHALYFSYLVGPTEKLTVGVSFTQATYISSSFLL